MTKATILLVDDEEAFVETMSKRLSKRRFEVRSAFTGTDALAVLSADKGIEAVILDVKMPGMDGIETLTAIKHRYPLMEVLMLTGHATIESAIDGMKMGAFDYLMKPCDLDVLVSKVDAAVDKKREHESKIVEARMRDITRRRA